MAKITYAEADGETHVVEARPGQTVMVAAVKNGVHGIAADCGGACACATCRVYVDETWRERIGPPSEAEREMLEFAGDATPGARLSCQIPVTEALDGLLLRLPESQH